MPELETLTADVEAVAPRVVLFDFDGVLFRGDAFHLFIRERYRRSWWRWLPAVLVAPLLLLILPFSWRVPMHVLVRIALFGLGERRYRLAAETFAADLARRPRQFHRDALQALRQHQLQGDRVIVVTGCEHTLVSGIVQQLGLTGLDVLAFLHGDLVDLAGHFGRDQNLLRADIGVVGGHVAAARQIKCQPGDQRDQPQNDQQQRAAITAQQIALAPARRGAGILP